MKKQIFTFLIILTLSLTMLAGCGDNGTVGTDDKSGSLPANTTSSNATQSESGGGEAFEYGEQYILNHLKEFHLIYNITTYENGETDTSTVEQIRTQDGIFWGISNEDGMLLIKNGDSYDMYANTGDGTYEKAGMQYTKEMVDSLLAGMNAYMMAYTAYGSEMKKTGETTVAGRDCTEYTFEFSVPYKYKNTYCIDKETGVCLKINIEVAGAGQKTGYEFEATKFVTSSVSLPAHQ
jgi:predicted small lipoprotein YifL